MKKEKLILALAAGIGAVAVTYKLLSKDIPAKATAVQPFNMNRYLGKWYEVARLPNKIEKDIKYLTEEYFFNEGEFKVLTSGYNVQKKTWKKASGKLKFAGPEDVGMLKVSYFGPFYASYNVLAIADDYRYALVSGSGLDYLWILSRETTIPDDVRTHFLSLAWKTGFKVDQLEWV